jgi:hypothetical protein
MAARVIWLAIPVNRQLDTFSSKNIHLCRSPAHIAVLSSNTNPSQRVDFKLNGGSNNLNGVLPIA